MKNILKTTVWLAALAAILYGGYRGMRVIQARKEAAKAAVEQEDVGPVKVAVVPVQVGKITQSVWVTGEVRALSAVDVTPEVTGRLERLRRADGALIEEGVEIRKGEIVAVIERDRYKTAVKSAEASVLVAKASRERARVNLADAKREKDRWTALIADGAGTRQQLDRAVTAFERAQAELQLADAQIKQAEAALAQAKVNLDKATIKAPFSGVVSRKYVDEGAVVGPTTPLFKLVDIRQVEITGGVADRRYPQIHIGKTYAEVEVDAYPGEKFSGYVSRIRPELDKATRTVAVTIRVPNDDARLKPHMYARIRLILQEHNQVPLVPDEALLSYGGEHQVYVVNTDKARLRKVRIGLEEGNLNEILDGLKPGEIVVVRGKERLRDGAAVETQEVEAP